MKLDTIYEDSQFNNSTVPEGYLLIFMGYNSGVSDGTVVKRYKDSSGNFGTLAGAQSGISDAEAQEIITSHVTTAENDAQDTQAYLVSSTEISNTLDSIIGTENSDPDQPSVVIPSPVFAQNLSDAKDNADTGQTIATVGNINYLMHNGVPCAQFDGYSYIHCSNSNMMPTGVQDRTLTAYVCPNAESSDKYVLSIGTSNNNTRYGFGFYANNSIGVWAKSNTVYYEFPYDNDVWYHIAVTFSDGIEKVYVNGELIGTNTHENIDTGVGGVCIGAGIEDWVDKFSGFISDVGVWNCTLNAEQVLELYNSIIGE